MKLDRVDTLADEELATRSQQGDRHALEILISRYRRLARHRSRGYFLTGGNADDLEQEALIGLSEAARDFRSAHQVTFRSFALVCISRQILSAVRSATSHKHEPLNQSVEIPSGSDATDPCLDELVASAEERDPANVVVSLERLRTLRDAIVDRLSDLELMVLALYLQGHTYQQIGDSIGRRTKSVDNAIQRIRAKLEPAMHAVTREGDEHESDPIVLIA